MSQPSKTAKDIFMAAIETEITERAAFLDAACAGDDVLRRQVEALLRVHDEPDSLLDRPRIDLGMPADGVPDPICKGEQPVFEQPGDSIGPYKLLQQIGEGGMGVVFMAEQTEPIQRTVALKIIKPGMDTRQVIARFEAERQALAMMDHPNIARVVDAGTTDTGRSYFVMDLVKGVPITEYCDAQHFTVRQRLELMSAVCQAVQHAHQKGIIHRDLKPSNVLVAEYDGKPVPKIIDFGVAKATDQRLTEKTMFTEYGQIIGTFEYMSPEQARFNQLDVDTRSDIYSLGVLLYELLAGSTPLEKERLRAAAYDEILRLISNDEPPRPSTRISSSHSLPSIAANRNLEPKKLTGLVRGELDWIVMKCLEKDRNRRYETASSLAGDVERYLQDEPVQACQPSASYRFRKFAWRNKKVLAAGGSIAAALFIGLGLSTWMYFRERAAVRVAEANEARATAEAAKSQLVAKFMTDMLKGVAPGVALGRDTQLLREILDRTADRLVNLKAQPEVEADLRATLGNVYSDLGEPASAAAMHKKALALRRELYGDEHPDVAQSLHDLGEVSYWDGRWEDAEVLHREAMELRRKLSNDQNRLAETAAIYRQLLELDPQGATEHNFHLRLAEFMFRTIPLWFDDDQAQEGRRLIRRAIDGYAQVASQCPNDLDRRLDAAKGYVKVAVLCQNSPGLRDNVEEAHRRLVAELSELCSAFPNSVQCQFQCALLYRSWALAVMQNIDSAYLSQAEHPYREAIKLLENKSLAAADPLRVSHCLASTHGYLGDVLMRLGRTKEAETEFRTAIHLYEQRPPEIEREPVEEKELAIDYMRFAYLLATLDGPEEASRLLDKAARSTERMGGADKATNWTFALAVMRLRLGDQAGYREACTALRKLVNIAGGTDAPELLPWTCALGPNAVDDLSGPLKQAEANVANPPTYAPYLDLTILGAVLYRMGQYDRAVPLLEKSIAQYADKRPVTTGTVFSPKLFLAMTRWQQGQRDEARRMLDEIQPAIERELQSPLKEFQRRAQLDVLHREAEALIQPKKADETLENKRTPVKSPSNPEP